MGVDPRAVATPATGGHLFAYSASGADTMWWGTTRGGFGTGTAQVGLSAQSTMTAGYAYGSDGLRRSKTVDGQTTGFTWDTSGGLPLLLSTHKAGLDTAIVYGPGNEAVAQIADDGTASWFHHDQLGTIRLTTNAAGAETFRGSHSAYGAPVASTGTAPLLGYAGQYRDVETGYQYLRARYYDPATAQFLTLDPLASTTLEPYGYTGANPLNATDPTGLFCVGSLCTPEIVNSAAGNAWDSTLGMPISGLGWVKENPGQAATIVSIGVCLVAILGTCGLVTVAAFHSAIGGNLGG